MNEKPNQSFFFVNANDPMEENIELRILLFVDNRRFFFCRSSFHRCSTELHRKMSFISFFFIFSQKKEEGCLFYCYTKNKRVKF